MTDAKRKVMKKKAVAKAATKKQQESRGRVPPMVKRFKAEHDPRVGKIGQPREAHIALEGPAEITVDDIEIIPGLKFRDKAAMEAFMHEPVTILIHNSPEKHAENPIQLGVNGRMVFVFRNQATIMKRCYVAQLAKARAEGVSQDPGNPNPDVANKLSISAGLRYPFSVLEDKNPLGSEWLIRECAAV